MRPFWVLLCVCTFSSFLGCNQAIGEKKTPIPLGKVPPDLLKIAQEKYPDVTFEAAFTEIEGGQSVIELKGKSKSGKNYEVEVTKDGKILD